ncbi:hypothetical protein CEXT_319311 [Caerostris extrusa]|uniref:Uncharacterized protein n=1 Tax=Caerostris extrusa TaxID=172846 RepID=A0AAV4R6F0_CAEEX|nr:hypothetical protein CEXT_319311 [Caerostris extrusa]
MSWMGHHTQLPTYANSCFTVHIPKGEIFLGRKSLSYKSFVGWGVLMVPYLSTAITQRDTLLLWLLKISSAFWRSLIAGLSKRRRHHVFKR